MIRRMAAPTGSASPTSSTAGASRASAPARRARVRAARRALARDEAFRKTISMDAHRFGSGEYRYFRYPLPPRVQRLRTALYPKLARIANAWQERLGDPARFEPTLAGFLRRCHAAGPGAPDPAAAALRGGRLQQSAPGPVRRDRVSAPGHDPALAARRRLRGRRVPARRAAPAPAVARLRGRARARRGDRVRDARAPGRGRARRLSRGAAPRREPAARGLRTALGIIFHDAA